MISQKRFKMQLTDLEILGIDEYDDKLQNKNKVRFCKQTFH
jgi:hypothetical protein